MRWNGIVFIILCAAGMVCLLAPPISFDIRGKKVLRVYVRYLCFRFNISGMLKEAAQKLFVFKDLTKTIGACLSFARRPTRIDCFRLKMVFSTGDAADTALLHGFLCMFFRALYPRISACKPEIVLSPCFLPHDKLSVDCDISFSIPAAVFFARIPALLVPAVRNNGRRVVPAFVI
jgi:hypothetical protein